MGSSIDHIRLYRQELFETLRTKLTGLGKKFLVAPPRIGKDKSVTPAWSHARGGDKTSATTSNSTTNTQLQEPTRTPSRRTRKPQATLRRPPSTQHPAPTATSGNTSKRTKPPASLHPTAYKTTIQAHKYKFSSTFRLQLSQHKLHASLRLHLYTPSHLAQLKLRNTASSSNTRFSSLKSPDLRAVWLRL